MRLDFSFNAISSSAFIQQDLPTADDIFCEADVRSARDVLIVCDANTRRFAALRGLEDAAVCVLEAGEAAKNWAAVEAILRAAHAAGLGRDGLVLGVGGGVVTDVSAFAASIYMRGCKLALVSTTLLGMADAALGGKTGIDFAGLKNFAGSFYPARAVWMPLCTLASLPPAEWVSGFAELVKAAVLDETEGAGSGAPSATSTDAVANAEFARFAALAPFFERADFLPLCTPPSLSTLEALLAAAVWLKGRVVQSDPRETGSERAKLNLGHTFGHALEASAGLGAVSHGKAVAWGMARACQLGLALGITPPARARAITNVLDALGYDTAAPHPAHPPADAFMAALAGDKKKKNGALRFIIPAARGAVIHTLERGQEALIQTIAFGGGL